MNIKKVNYWNDLQEEANENGSSTETDEEYSQHEQLSVMSAANSEQHPGMPSASYPNPLNSMDNPEAMMSYPSTSSMSSNPTYPPPPGCYPPQGMPGLPPQGVHNPYSMQMNKHM